MSAEKSSTNQNSNVRHSSRIAAMAVSGKNFFRAESLFRFLRKRRRRRRTVVDAQAYFFILESKAHGVREFIIAEFAQTSQN